MSDTEHDTLDRRALIRKGLIAAGAVAAAEVTVLASPAFALSGTFSIQWRRDGNSQNITRLTPTATAGADTFCGAPFETAWDAATPDSHNTPQVLMTRTGNANTPTFTIDTAGCTLTDAVRSTGNAGPCVNPTSENATSATFGGVQANSDFYFIVTCV